MILIIIKRIMNKIIYGDSFHYALFLRDTRSR